jgi:hypothetical protein
MKRVYLISVPIFYFCENIVLLEINFIQFSKPVNHEITLFKKILGNMYQSTIFFCQTEYAEYSYKRTDVLGKIKSQQSALFFLGYQYQSTLEFAFFWSLLLARNNISFWFFLSNETYVYT